MWFGSSTNLGKLSTGDRLIHVGPDTIEPTTEVRDLGVYFDSELNMRSHVRRIASACYYHLRRLRALRSLLGQEATARLVSAFVLSRLDYCNAILIGLPASTLAPLQRVMHAAARLVCDLKPRDHVTSSLRALHWLPVKQRIKFKLCLLVHLAVNGRALFLSPGPHHTVCLCAWPSVAPLCQQSRPRRTVIPSQTWRSHLLRRWAMRMEPLANRT